MEACGTETIRYGKRVTVVALPAPPVFLTPKGLDHVGPRAFGYDLDFRSVFAGDQAPEPALASADCGGCGELRWNRRNQPALRRSGSTLERAGARLPPR